MALLRNPTVRRLLEEAAEAAPEAEAAFRRCQRLLPHVWVRRLEDLVQACRTLLISLQASLQQPVGPAGAGTRGPGSHRDTPAVPAHLSLNVVDVGSEQSSSSAELAARHELCDGCGQRALGMRRCSACRQAWYCSRACQVAHRQQQRQTCNSA